ncbi:MAG: hypothetical protein K6C99_10345 [Lachnospiraceae bacterium]|nr:hypothetical protein [Lachnospiraceae bacterium]
MKKVTVNLLSAALCTAVAATCIVGNAGNTLARSNGHSNQETQETHSATGKITVGNKQYDTIEAAIKAAKPGDTVFLESGAEYCGTVNLESVRGAQGNPITITTTGEGMAVITGHPNVAADDGLVSINNSSYLIFKNLNFKDYRTGKNKVGLEAIDIRGTSSDIMIIGCKFENIGHDYVKDGTQKKANAHAIIAKSNSSSKQISNIRVLYNEVTGCELGQSEAVVFNGNVVDSCINFNYIHDNDNIGIDFIGYEEDIFKDYNRAKNCECIGNYVSNITSYENPAYGTHQRGADGIYVDGGTKIVIADNFVESCDIGIEVASEWDGYAADYVDVFNNYVSGSYYAGISIGGSDEGDDGSTNACHFHHNTLVGQGLEIQSIEDGHSNDFADSNITASSASKIKAKEGKGFNESVRYTGDEYSGASSNMPMVYYGMWGRENLTDSVYAAELASFNSRSMLSRGADTYTTSHELPAEEVVEPTEEPTEEVVEPTEAPTEEVVEPTEAPTEEVKPTEAPTEEVKPTEAATEEVKPTEAATEEVKPTEAAAEEVKPTEAPTEEVKPTEAATEEVKPTEAPVEIVVDNGDTGIVIDGNAADWEEYDYYTNGSMSIWTDSDDHYFYFCIKAGDINKYQLMINSDNKSSTGYKASGCGVEGVDYLIENGKLYKSRSRKWEFDKLSSDISTIVKSGDVIEIRTSIDELSRIGNDYSFSFIKLDNNYNTLDYVYGSTD